MSVLASLDCLFFIPVEIFLVLDTLSDFQLKPRHFGCGIVSLCILSESSVLVTFSDTSLAEDLLLLVGIEVQVLDLVLLTPKVGWGFHFPLGLLRINFCLGGVRVLPACLPQALR